MGAWCVLPGLFYSEWEIKVTWCCCSVKINWGVTFSSVKSHVSTQLRAAASQYNTLKILANNVPGFSPPAVSI